MADLESIQSSPYDLSSVSALPAEEIEPVEFAECREPVDAEAEYQKYVRLTQGRQGEGARGLTDDDAARIVMAACGVFLGGPVGWGVVAFAVLACHSAPDVGDPIGGSSDSGAVRDGSSSPPLGHDSGTDSGRDAGISTPPTLVSPSEDLTLPPTRAFLSWNDGFIPAGETVHHYKYCSTTRGITTIVGDLCPDGRNVTPHYDVIDLVSGATYLWKVQTCFDELGTDCTPYSGVRAFMTDDSVVAWWRFDGNFSDSSGNGHNGTVVSSAETPAFVSVGDFCVDTPVTDLIGTAVCFDGGNDVVTFGDVLDSMAEMTVEARLKTIDFTDSNEFLVSKYAGGGDASFELSLLNGKGYFFTNNTSNGGVGLQSQSQVDDSNWHQLVGSYDGEWQSISVDGRRELTGTQSGSINNSMTSLCIGAGCGDNANPPSTSLFFGGILDEVLIYNRGLLGAEVLNNFCSVEALAGTDPLPDLCVE